MDKLTLMKFVFHNSLSVTAIGLINFYLNKKNKIVRSLFSLLLVERMFI